MFVLSDSFKMRYAIVASALVAGASAHGLVTSIEGANGVSMPGLSGKFAVQIDTIPWLLTIFLSR